MGCAAEDDAAATGSFVEELLDGCSHMRDVAELRENACVKNRDPNGKNRDPNGICVR